MFRRLSSLALPLALVATAACGAGENQRAETSPDSATLTGAPVGSYKDAADSAIAAGKQQIDSLRNSGVSALEGMDSAAAAGTRTTDAEAAQGVPTQVAPSGLGSGAAAPARAGDVPRGEAPRVGGAGARPVDPTKRP